MKEHRILLIEDDQVHSKILKEKLIKPPFQFTVDCITSLAQIGKNLDEAYDLVLADLNLPDGSSFDFFFPNGKQAYSVPVVIITSSRNEVLALQALESGAADYVLKAMENFNTIGYSLKKILKLHKHPDSANQSFNEKSIEDLIKRSPTIIYKLDQQDVSQTNYISPNVLENIGFESGYMLKHDWQLEQIHPDDYHEFSEARNTWLLNGAKKPFQWQYRLIQCDRSIAWIEDTLVARKDENEKISELIGSITKRKDQFEQAERLKKITENIDGAVYKFRMRPDGSFHLPYASAGLYKLTGVLPAQVIDDAGIIFGLIHPDDLEGVQNSIQRSAIHNEQWVFEFRVKKNNTYVWIQGKSSPIRQADGSIVWNGFLEDTTQQKELMDHYKYSSYLLDNVSDAIVSTNLDFEVVSWNRAAESLYALKKEDAVGKVFNEIIQTSFPGGSEENFLSILNKDEFWQQELVQINARREPCRVQSTVRLLKNNLNVKTGILFINRNLSDKKA